MKKFVFITFLLCVLTVGRVSAQEQTYYGGVKGDWSVGFNLLTSGTEYQIKGTYMLTDRLVLDGGVRVNDVVEINKYNQYNYEHKTQDKEFSVGANYLLRPGERLQPFVGGKFSLRRTFTHAKYDHNEELSSGNDRISGTNNWSYGLCAVFGVDYFITPRVSLGGRISVGGFIEDNYQMSGSGDFDGEYTEIEYDTYALRFRTTSSTVLLSFYF